MLRFSWCIFLISAAISTKVHCWSDEEKQAVHEKVLPIVQECGEEFGVSEEEIHEWKKDKKDPDDTNACMYACIFKKLGMLDDNGMFSEETTVENSKKYLSSEEDMAKVVEVAKNCQAVNDEEVTDGEKGCDRAKLIFSCFIQQADKFGLGS